MGFIASASVLLAGAVWGLRLVLAPGLFADGSGALLAVSLVAVSVVASLGLVLARGRWARRVAFVVVAGEIGLGAVMDLDAWGFGALAASAAALMLLSGPWLDRFLRQLPPSEPIPVTAMLLAIGLLMIPGLLAVLSPGGVDAVHWVASAVSLATAWGFARALRPGLWSARLAVPGLLVASAVASTPAGRFGSLALAVGVAGLAWSAPVNRSVTPLVEKAAGVAVPPELVPADLLAEAGYDDRGRPATRPPDPEIMS